MDVIPFLEYLEEHEATNGLALATPDRRNEKLTAQTMRKRNRRLVFTSDATFQDCACIIGTPVSGSKLNRLANEGHTYIR